MFASLRGPPVAWTAEHRAILPEPVAAAPSGMTVKMLGACACDGVSGSVLANAAPVLVRVRRVFGCFSVGSVALQGLARTYQWPRRSR